MNQQVIEISEDSDLEIVEDVRAQKRQKVLPSSVSLETLLQLERDAPVQRFPMQFSKNNTKQILNLQDHDANPFFKGVNDENAGKILSFYQMFHDARMRGSVPHIETPASNGPWVRVGFFNLDDFSLKSCLSLFPRPEDLPVTMLSAWKSLRALGLNPRSGIDFATEQRKRRCQANMINDVNADVLAVAEVENSAVLGEFNRVLLSNMGYDYSVTGEGCNSSGMCVGLLSRHPILSSKMHKDGLCREVFPKGVLEVDLDVDGTVLTVYVCHLKALVKQAKKEDRERKVATTRWMQLVHLNNQINQRWGASQYQGNFMVLGDLNNIPNSPEMTKFFQEGGVVNVCARQPDQLQWTHVAMPANQKVQKYRQLDYICLSRVLEGTPDNKDSLPMILRSGLASGVLAVEGSSYTHSFPPGKNLRVSDHCPLAMDVRLQNLRCIPACGSSGQLFLDRSSSIRFDTKGEYQPLDSRDYKPAPQLPSSRKAGWIYSDLSTVNFGEKLEISQTNEPAITDLTYSSDSDEFQITDFTTADYVE